MTNEEMYKRLVLGLFDFKRVDQRGNLPEHEMEDACRGAARALSSYMEPRDALLAIHLNREKREHAEYDDKYPDILQHRLNVHGLAYSRRHIYDEYSPSTYEKYTAPCGCGFDKGEFDISAPCPRACYPED